MIDWCKELGSLELRGDRTPWKEYTELSPLEQSLLGRIGLRQGGRVYTGGT